MSEKLQLQMMLGRTTKKKFETISMSHVEIDLDLANTAKEMISEIGDDLILAEIQLLKAAKFNQRENGTLEGTSEQQGPEIILGIYHAITNGTKRLASVCRGYDGDEQVIVIRCSK